MPSRSIVNLIRKFLRETEHAGIPVFAGVLFGSYAQGNAQADSDIDLLVISRNSGRTPDRDLDTLWRLRARVDFRIEPLLVSKSRWDRDHGSPMLAAIRQEGRMIRLPRNAPVGG
jgi:predicted nucleotidyltransferase